MRGAIIDSIFSVMEHDKSVFFVTADMGINLVEKIQDKFPDRYLNVGIAEQNMVGVCAGLINAGFKPFAYTISNFAVHRCFEQIRNDICIHHNPIVLMGTSTGYDNAPLGPTHHIIDDWAALKALHGIDIYCPSTMGFAKSIVSRLLASPKASYLRIPKNGLNEPERSEENTLFGEPTGETLLVGYGGTSSHCVEAAKSKPAVSALICNRLHPLDGYFFKNLASGFKRVVVVEDQFPSSGLYGSLCNVWVEQKISASLEVISKDRDYVLDVGNSAEYYLAKLGLDTKGIQKIL